ncbi:acyl-CoA dehydrogenase family protein [Micromonospora sp. WMMD754]|uniref:acyl-CoA dehydrogenase family protein n=1 Tax=Micromonospora sp. WMMD754 TaxID=3404114 RepID=UPI003BF56E4D
MRDQLSERDGLRAAAEQVADLAGKRAGAAEAERRLHPEVVRAVLDAGFARHFVPARWGGDAGTFTEVSRAVAAIGESCASTAWYASLTAGLGRMAAYLPAAGQAELWRDGPDPLIVGALMPLGEATPSDGGWRLTGRWPYVSAIEFSDWALVCAMVRTDGRPQARFFAVPRAAYTIEDTWFTVGMRATGSNTLVLDDVRVSAEMSFTRDVLTVGTAAEADAPCHRVPLKAANGLGFAAPILGTATGALKVWTSWIAEKVRTAPANGITGGPGYDAVLARSAAEIDAARLLLDRVAAVVDGGPVGALETARNGRDCAFAVDLLVGAVDRLFRAAGTRAQADGNALQRAWRDANAAASHVVLQFDPAAAAYAAQAWHRP